MLDFENLQEGYVSWIHSEAGKVHKIKLKLLVPLTTVGGETQLRLRPATPPLGKLELLVAAGSIEAKASEESELVQSEPTADGKTQLKVLRIGGDFELAGTPRTVTWQTCRRVGGDRADSGSDRRPQRQYRGPAVGA